MDYIVLLTISLINHLVTVYTLWPLHGLYMAASVATCVYIEINN
jgi:hypothetical protein